MWTSKTPPLGWSFELTWETWNCWARYKQNMSKDKTLLSQKTYCFVRKLLRIVTRPDRYPDTCSELWKLAEQTEIKTIQGWREGGSQTELVENTLYWAWKSLGPTVKPFHFNGNLLLQFRAGFKAELTKKQNSLTHCWMSNFYRGVEMVGLQPSCVSVSERKQE